MKCPKCKHDLIRGEGTRIYQTIDEHVCQPNATPRPREYYVCPNECYKGMFGFDGSFYSAIVEDKPTPEKYWYALDSFVIDVEIQTAKDMIERFPENDKYKDQLKELEIVTGQRCPECDGDMIEENESLHYFECLDCHKTW